MFFSNKNKINILFYMKKNFYIIKKFIPFKIKAYMISILSFNDDGYCSYGIHNSDKTFYVIGGFNAGLYSIIHSVIGYIIYANSKGYIPVIDYTNHYTKYHPKGHKCDIWNQYFVQTTHYTLKEVYSSKNVIHSPNNKFPYNFYSTEFIHIINNDIEEILKLNHIFKNHVTYNESTNLYIDELYEPLKKLKLIGVYLRGTDYKNAKGHPIQPELSEIFDSIDQILASYIDIDGIFVSTEEDATLEQIKIKYGDIITFQNRPRIINFNESISTPDHRFNRSDDIFLTGLEYLADIEILSRLDFLVCGVSNGSAAIIERNGMNFIQKKVIFKGYN